MGSETVECGRSALEPATADDRLKKTAMADASLEIIDATGKPLTRKDLYRKLQERGVQVGGKGPLANLGNILWKNKERIVNLEGHGFWNAAKPYEPAGYRPK
jgi:hypothetical protein